MTAPPRHHLYRAFLQHLQKIPDRQVWATTLPKFRSLLESQPAQNAREEEPPAETSRAASLRASRAARDLKGARKLQAAVSAQPHTLLRLLEKAYALKGAVRWDLLRHIQETSPIQEGKLPHRPDLPPCVLPFRPEPLRPREKPAPRLDNRIKPTAIRLAAKREWKRDWEKVKVPLILPPTANGPRTGWEEAGIVEGLRRSAGLRPDLSPRGASSGSVDAGDHAGGAVRLPAHLELLFPSPRTPLRDLPPYPTPPPAHTRQNPHTWSLPRRLDARLVRNTYRRLWRQFVWSRPSPHGDRWEACTYEEMLAYSATPATGSPTGKSTKGKAAAKPVESGYFSIASAEDLRWI